MHFCHCHAIDLCFPACFYSGECSIPPVLLQCVWTVFMPSSDPPLTLQTRPDPIRHPLHPTPKRIGLLLCLFSSRLVYFSVSVLLSVFHVLYLTFSISPLTVLLVCSSVAQLWGTESSPEPHLISWWAFWSKASYETCF